jgi:hypothetical protein
MQQQIINFIEGGFFRWRLPIILLIFLMKKG